MPTQSKAGFPAASGHPRRLEYHPASLVAATHRKTIMHTGRRTTIRRHPFLTFIAFIVALCCASCTDLQLRKYRDDAFLQQYRYALGEQYVQVNGLRLCYQELGRSD